MTRAGQNRVISCRAYVSVLAGTWTVVRARERIEAIGAAPLGARALRRQVLTVLGEVIGFGAYVWVLTDPVTTVGAAPLAEVPCLTELPALIRAKYATQLNRWTVLRQQAAPVALLHETAGGELSRTRVWREVLSRYAIGDVASAVFADQFGCWGFLDLWRDDRREPFSSGDTGFLASLAPSLTAPPRRCQARTFTRPAAPPPH